jgi:hypothetical protein
MGRSWIKLWLNEWLDGTTRYEMSGAQRAFWVDLLALAGRSRCDGIICAGRAGERFIGYPLSRFEALDAGSEIDILETLQLFENSGKIKLEITSETPVKLYKITILNWSKYQSEYQRQKGYRQSSSLVRGKVTSEVTSTVTTQLTEKLLVEGEVEGDVEREKERVKDDPPQSPGSKWISGKTVDSPDSKQRPSTKRPPKQQQVASLKPRDFSGPKDYRTLGPVFPRSGE